MDRLRSPDLGVALVWALAGALIAIAAWRMDRLTHQGINPWSAPGLLPGVVGGLMVILAACLALRRPAAAAAVDRGSDGEPDAGTPASSAWRTVTAAALCIAFAGFGTGRGLPFAAVAATFIFVFTTVFSWSQWQAGTRQARGLALTLVIAVIAAQAIAWLFEQVFLVRLP